MITKGRGILSRHGGAWLEAFAVGWLLGNNLDAGLLLLQWTLYSLGVGPELGGLFS
jgi:hypothetical protein